MSGGFFFFFYILKKCWKIFLTQNLQETFDSSKKKKNYFPILFTYLKIEPTMNVSPRFIGISSPILRTAPLPLRRARLTITFLICEIYHINGFIKSFVLILNWVIYYDHLTKCRTMGEVDVFFFFFFHSLIWNKKNYLDPETVGATHRWEKFVKKKKKNLKAFNYDFTLNCTLLNWTSVFCRKIFGHEFG